MHWEYKTITHETATFSGFFADESDFTKSLNELGRLGWELVTSFDITKQPGQTCQIGAILKRPSGVEEEGESRLR